MDERLAALVVVALCVVALGFTAASLTTSPQERTGTGNGSGGAGSTLPEQSGESSSVSGPDLDFLPGWIVSILLVLALVVALAGTLVVRGAVIKGGLLAVVGIGLTVALAFLVDGDPGLPVTGSANATARSGNGSSGAEIAASDGQTSLALYGTVGLALVVAAVALVYAGRSVDASLEFSGDDEPSPDPTAVAAAADRAATAIEESAGVDRSNAVYEAWTEMTDAVDVSDPATVTPGEFADAATDAGAARRPVADLTEVFEAVRYGDEPAARYETQAVDALRAIEADLGADDSARVEGDDERGGRSASGEPRDGRDDR